MLIETLNQYKEKRYQGIEDDFLAQSFAEWDKNFAAICEFWRAGLREAVAGAAALQQETGAVCSFGHNRTQTTGLFRHTGSTKNIGTICCHHPLRTFRKEFPACQPKLSGRRE